VRLSVPLLVAFVSTAGAADRPVDYAREVKPILRERCFNCHGALKQNAKLRLDSGELIRKGGSSGPAVVPGKSAESLLIERVSDADDETRMPPELKPLAPDQIATLKTWIDQGANYPADDKPEPDPRDHWAFRTPVRPPVPNVAPAWGNNPIDAFLAAEWQKRGLRPQPFADKRLLLRRVYFDLIGLPPTPDQTDAFLNDSSANAYEKVVDRLLDSPQYGERWGRHFMDIWRYSDWWGLGAEVRNSQKHIWHWRDWIVESLNADKGYDQMVREMLAADELYPTDPGRLRASGYLARQYFIFNRTTWLDETVEHTAKAFLGLTMNCTKCHDHKYDPISHTDYYRFRAFFEPYQVRADMVPGQPDFEKDGIPRAFDCNLDAPTYRHNRGDDRQPITAVKITPGLPAVLGGELKVEPVSLPLEAGAPHLRPFVEESYRRAADAKLAAARDGRTRARGVWWTALCVAGQNPGPAPAALAVADRALDAAEAVVLSLQARFAAERARHSPLPKATLQLLAGSAARAQKREALAKAEEDLAKAELEVVLAEGSKKPAAEKKRDAAKTAVANAKKATENPGAAYTAPRGSLKTRENNLEDEASRDKPFPATSTGRRSALARWITDRQNPLAARVAVNYVWARHFGRPLIPTVFDFGRKGTRPTHPELLDWLAVELVDHDWSLKHLHRLLVTSAAYRLESSAAGAEPETVKRDGENKFLWRRNPVRMEAQAVRDSLLHLAGQLDLTLGGPSIDVNAQADLKRRSLYFVHSHNDHHKFLMQFDDAAVLECYRRTESIVPQQALTLSNSKFAVTAADGIAARLQAMYAKAPDGQFVTAAFEMILSSTPTAEERQACLDALAEWETVLTGQKHPDPTAKARANLVAALVNHNDFLTVR
jgi:Protein of unknown function (DUF1553)/Protein of unknown function (DUF1549)/Planctomycete cytochrome C